MLILCDEVLNFVNRHRNLAEPFHAFIQNLTVATTGTTRGAAMISLPRSQVEMTDWDQQWQEKITKVVRRVAKDLIANDESEISEVVRRRLFEDLGNEKTRRNVAKAYADWCFERRAQLPPEWTAVDIAATDVKARDFLRSRFEACFPFHPATLSVFQRKWQTLAQYQQTRGTLAMFAQWISWACREGFQQARREPLITLGSAPLEVSDFRATVLGQIGEPRLAAAIETDIAGQHSHARALDADTSGPLRDIHRRVGAAILFESSGGQTEKVAHLPELRFAIGEPDVETTSVDNAACALESKAFFISPVGTDGFKIYHKATIRKAVGDRRADPEAEWSSQATIRQQIADWTKHRGKSDRLYPGALIWCLKKPGRELREKVELWLAWKRVAHEVAEGTLGADYDRTDRAEIEARVREAGEASKDEVWGGYRFVVIADTQEADGLKVIDLGAGHASGSETLCGRIITAMKSQALLNESVGAGYIERNWPPALKESGAWSLASLRQSFLNGALTRLLDPDAVLRGKIAEFVQSSDFGLASGQHADGTYDRIWFGEPLASDEVAFESDVFLLTKAKAKAVKAGPIRPPVAPPEPPIGGPAEPQGPEPREPRPPTVTELKALRVFGTIPPEVWNRLGTKLIPKLKSGTELKVGVDFIVKVDSASAAHIESDLHQILDDLGLADSVRIELQ